MIETNKVLFLVFVFFFNSSHAFKLYEKLDSFVVEMTNQKGLIKTFYVIICLSSIEND